MLEDIFTSALVSSAILGLGGILGKVWVNRVREIDRIKYEDEISKIKSKLEMSLHANKAVFEKEFNSCEQTWNALLKFKSETSYLLDEAGDRAKFENQMLKCFEQHSIAHDLLYSNAPFIPENIRDEFFEVALGLQTIYQLPSELLESNNFEKLFIEFYDEQKRSVNEKIEKLESLIRARYVQPKL